MTTKQIFILLLSGGVGTRMKSKEKKQFLTFKNRPIFIWSVKTFLSLSQDYDIIPVLVYSLGDKKRFQTILNQHLKPKEITLLKLTQGGKERSDSVYNGLKEIKQFASQEDIILIHDCARPLIQKQDIIKIINSLQKNPAATLAYSLTDTIKSIHTDKTIHEHLIRDNLKGILTPQGFHYSILWNAYQKYMTNPYPVTDDSQIVCDFGHQVSIVEGEKTNIKLTTPEDILVAEAYYGLL